MQDSPLTMLRHPIAKRLFTSIQGYLRRVMNNFNLFVSLFDNFNYLVTIDVPLSLERDRFLIFFSPRINIILIMNYRDYITIEPNKRGGKPCVRGLRITVYEVLKYLASEMTEAEILDDFPDLTREDLKACIAFAADRERRFMTASSSL